MQKKNEGDHHRRQPRDAGTAAGIARETHGDPGDDGHCDHGEPEGQQHDDEQTAAPAAELGARPVEVGLRHQVGGAAPHVPGDVHGERDDREGHAAEGDPDIPSDRAAEGERLSPDGQAGEKDAQEEDRVDRGEDRDREEEDQGEQEVRQRLLLGGEPPLQEEHGNVQGEEQHPEAEKRLPPVPALERELEMRLHAGLLDQDRAGTWTCARARLRHQAYTRSALNAKLSCPGALPAPGQSRAASSRSHPLSTKAGGRDRLGL